MSWQTLLAIGRVRTHTTSSRELDDLRAVIQRDLDDAAIAALSADRRFATAYNAVLQIANAKTVWVRPIITAAPA